MTDYYSAKHWAEKARKHAVGNSTENPDGSAKYWAEKAMAASESVSIVAGLDINDCLPNTYPVFTNPEKCGIEADVIVDFSHRKQHLFLYQIFLILGGNS